MESTKFDDIIPENEKGGKTDTTHVQEYQSESEAREIYNTSKQRLLNISQWHTYAGSGTADFQLTDPTGQSINRLAQEGDHFRINIPGPGSTTGDGYDWVQIQSIKAEDSPELDFTAITVKPATNPQNSKSDTAHFFNEAASSTFIVQRKATVVSAEVHGRNELPNTDAENIIDKARNVLVAAGALLGLSDVQWKALVKGLITEEDAR